jgi:CBS domain-containing protein
MSIERLIRRPVHTLPPHATCVEAARRMRDEQIGSVVVVDDGAPLGIVTDRDIVTRVLADGADADKLELRDVMSGEPIFLGGDRNLDQVIATMRDLAIRRVPVVDEDGQLLGIVALDDLLVLLADQLSGLAAVARQEIGSLQRGSGTVASA